MVDHGRRPAGRRAPDAPGRNGNLPAPPRYARENAVGRRVADRPGVVEIEIGVVVVVAGLWLVSRAVEALAGRERAEGFRAETRGRVWVDRAG